MPEKPERRIRTGEDLLKEGPPLKWYYGFGRTDIGITNTNYNIPFHQAYAGQLSSYFGDWAHIGIVPRVFGLKSEQVEKYTPVIEKMHGLAVKIFELSGYWPEEIEAKGSALLQLYYGQETAPFEVILVEPYKI